MVNIYLSDGTIASRLSAGATVGTPSVPIETEMELGLAHVGICGAGALEGFVFFCLNVTPDQEGR